MRLGALFVVAVTQLHFSVSHASSSNNSSIMSSQKNRRQQTVKLYLTRHGETVANTIRYVVGQSDSPLTERGMEQTRALGKSSQWRSYQDAAKFWRIYSSDLPRTIYTTQILLDSIRTAFLAADGADDPNNTILLSNDLDFFKIIQAVRFDARLREIAKGARQELSKDLSYDEALRVRQERRIPAGPIPLLETEEDGWARAQDWLNEVLSDALRQTEDAPTSSDLHVLVVSHSGFLRNFLRRLLGDDRLRAHPDATYDPIDGRFAVPNTSLTVLTITISFKENSETLSLIDKIDIDLLTSTKHLTSEKQFQEEK